MNPTRTVTLRTDALWLLALYALSAATFPYAALIVDSGRDLAWGWSITQGEAWPLYGPSLNGLWQPGPVWYYTLAMALALTGSIGGTAGVIGLVAALKIPLAYALGREWSRTDAASRDSGSALGLCLAAAIALPGWNTLGQLALSHTSLVEVSVVATLWLALRAWHERSVGALIAGGLILGLAVHAHPTALVAAPPLAFAAWRVRRWPGWGLAAAAFALPFLPAVVGEMRAGWPQFDASAGYFGSGDYLSRLRRAPAVMAGASWGSLGFVREFLLARWPAVAPMTAFASGALYLGAALGLVLSLRRERAYVATIVLFSALAWLAVLLLRDSTPAWMVYACAPFGAALLALGWQSLWRTRAPRLAAQALAGLALLLSAALLADRIAASRSGVQSFPSAALADISQPLRRDPPIRFWLPAYGHDAAARRLCDEETSMAVHGDLATALHFGQGVAIALHCARPDSVRIGGGAAARHLAGVPRTEAEALGLRGTAMSWGYVLIEPRARVHPEQGVSAQVHTRYLMDDYRARIVLAPTTVALDLACGPNDLLVVTNLLPGLNAPFEVRSRDGSPTPVPRAETLASRYFACPGEGRFDFELIAFDARAADVFVLSRD